MSAVMFLLFSIWLLSSACVANNDLPRPYYPVVSFEPDWCQVRTLPDLDDREEIPLSKSLGYAVQKSLSKSLEDVKISKEYLDLYQEMLRASRESYEKVDEEEAKLETIVGREKAELLKKGVIDHRRSISRMRSPVGRRRVRSQKARREKLNSQSLRSHQQHIRHAGKEYQFLLNED